MVSSLTLYEDLTSSRLHGTQDPASEIGLPSNGTAIAVIRAAASQGLTNTAMGTVFYRPSAIVLA